MFKDGLTQILKYLERLNMMNKYEKWYENPIFSARAPNKKKIIKIIVDDNYDAIYDFNSSFDENLLYTVIVPIKLIDNIDVLITSFLLSDSKP